MTIAHFDVAVIGGGIAGATAACHISNTHHVALLEQERELAFHTTSRSAAIYYENDGDLFQRLNRASHEFLLTDHDELSAPLLASLGVFDVGNATMRDAMYADYLAGVQLTPAIQFVEGSAVRDLCPVLRPEQVTCGVYEPTAASIDAMALHQLYVRRASDSGAEVRRNSRVTQIRRSGDRFVLTAGATTLTATTIVNAAGAWGDVIGQMAGAAPLGLTPMRRTAFTARVDQSPDNWPFVYAPIPALHCYFKPEAGDQLLCSLADETASDPVDARPEEIDVAAAIEHINTITTLNLRSVSTTWAGLRTFAPDRSPVWGWDDNVEGFYWFVGQGGWGIASSPAAGMIAAAAINNDAFPEALVHQGVRPADVTPDRLRAGLAN